jgi:hypothetical protein
LDNDSARLNFLPGKADQWNEDGMSSDEITERELMLNRFRKLLSEITRGVSSRNTFLPWEVEILLDLETCDVFARRRPETLRQYERAVERQLERGPGPPMKLSDFLALRNRSR